MTKKVKLDGLEISEFIKERQATNVRSLKQALKVLPKLAIIRSSESSVVDSYLKIKQKYADDIGVEVVVYRPTIDELSKTITDCNEDSSIQGIILQLPFDGLEDLDAVLALIDPRKDVDNLGGKSQFDSPTAVAILWLLAAYNIELLGKHIVVVGSGRLVGGPLSSMLGASSIPFGVVDEFTKNPEELLKEADIVISGVGKPGLIRSESLKSGAIVIDAGLASDKGVLKGDVEDAARLREDISITPKTGGVGPLTVAALYENLLKACRV